MHHQIYICTGIDTSKGHKRLSLLQKIGCVRYRHQEATVSVCRGKTSVAVGFKLYFTLLVKNATNYVHC